VALFFRVFDKGLYTHTPENTRDHTGAADSPHTGEAPLSMLIPASLLAIVIIIVGVFNQIIINKVIRFVVPLGF